MTTESKTKKPLSAAGIIAIMLASSLTIMVGEALTSALPAIKTHFNMTISTSWLITMPSLGVVFGALFCGEIIDQLGPYKTICIGLFFYALFGVSGAVMPNITLELIDRFLLGCGCSLVMTSSTDLISEFYHGRQRLKMIAVQGMAIELGGVIFLSLGGQLAEVSWNASFLIYLIAAIALIMILIFVPKKAPDYDGEEIDQSKALEKGESSVKVVLVIAFISMLTFFTCIVSLPIYLQTDMGYSAGFSGYYLASISVVAVIFAAIMPKMVDRFSAKASLLVSAICFTVGHLLFFTAAGNHVLLYLAAPIMGIGFGFSTPLINNLTVERSTPETKAKNLSGYSIAQFSGQFVSSLVVSAVTGSHTYLLAAVLGIINIMVVLFVFDRGQKIF